MDEHLFGATAQLAGGGVSNARRARNHLRSMIALTLFKNSFDLSDEELVQRFAENFYLQYFAGYDYFDPFPSCDASPVGRFRGTLGEAGPEELFSVIIHKAVDVCPVKKSEVGRVIIGTTMQEKAIAHPVDSRQLEIARALESGNGGEGRRHRVEADLRSRKPGAAPSSRWLRPCKLDQETEQGRQTPTHDSGYLGSGGPRVSSQWKRAAPVPWPHLT